MNRDRNQQDIRDYRHQLGNRDYTQEQEEELSRRREEMLRWVMQRARAAGVAQGQLHEAGVQDDGGVVQGRPREAEA
jgi:hypothetical protein